jgi:hypothetical protein
MSALQIHLTKADKSRINSHYSVPLLNSIITTIIPQNRIIVPSNKATFLTSKIAPLKVLPSTYTTPGENEMVVKNRAVAINPYDWIIQGAPSLVVSWIKLPFIVGTDVAGDIV